MAKFSRDEIKKHVIDSVVESLALDSDENVTEQTNLVNDLSSDSLDIMDMMFLFEEKFDVGLDKDDFNFLRKINMSREEAVVDEQLTIKAKTALKKWLPSLELEKDLKPADLAKYLTIESFIIVMQEHLKEIEA